MRILPYGNAFRKECSTPGEIYEDIHLRIIEPELFERCKQIIDANRYVNHISDYSYLLRKQVYCGKCSTRMTSYSRTSKSSRVMKYYKCWNSIGKQNCDAKFVKKELLYSIIIQALQSTLTVKNLSIFVDEIYKKHNAKLIDENSVKRLKRNCRI